MSNGSRRTAPRTTPPPTPEEELAAEVLSLLPGGDRGDKEDLVAAMTATQLVQQYAPAAPKAVRQEAARRCAYWLLRKPVHIEETTRSGPGVGGSVTKYAVHQFSALRHSGAMAILSPWKVRRAGAI